MSYDYGTTPIEPLGEERPKRNMTPFIIGAIVLIVLCCCCLLIGILGWNFGDQLLQALGG